MRIDNQDIDKIVFLCKEADCRRNCRIYMNVSTDHQKHFKLNEPELPKLCPFMIVTPIWTYEGVHIVKHKVDEVVLHG